MADAQQSSGGPLGQPPQVQGTPGPSGVGQTLGQTLLRAGGNLLAQGVAEHFDSPALGQAISETATATADLMQSRFWNTEFENFQQTYGKQYEITAHQVMDEFKQRDEQLQGKVDETSKMMQTQNIQDIMTRIQDLDSQFFQNASKFSNNPQINELSNNLMTQRTEWMNRMMGAHKDIEANAASLAQLQKTQFESSPEMLSLNKEKAQTDVNLTKAQTSEASARAGLLGRTDSNQQGGRTAKTATEISNVPLADLPGWLIQTPTGQRILGPYIDAVTANQTDTERSKAGDSFNEDQIKSNVARRAPAIRNEAVKRVITDLVTHDEALTNSIIGKSAPIRDTTSVPKPDVIGKMPRPLSMEDIPNVLDKGLPDLQLPPMRDVTNTVAEVYGEAYKIAKSKSQNNLSLPDGTSRPMPTSVKDFESIFNSDLDETINQTFSKSPAAVKAALKKELSKQFDTAAKKAGLYKLIGSN